jgi:2-succinyl-6-hydroxy-2,4-cyclohexadiene-1-carboxylate synthase
MGPVLLLHGFLGSSADFDPLRSLLPEEAEVSAPDWPGHGARGGERSPSDYDLAAHVGPVNRWIDSRRRPGTLLGYSMGGRLLQHALAARDPLPAGWRVVLVSTSTGIDDPEAAANRRRGDAAAARLLREEGTESFLRYWHNQTFFRPLMALPAAQLEPILARRRAADPLGLALSLEHAGPGSLPSTRGALARLKGRVDLVAGEADPAYVRHAREMAALIPGSKVAVLPRAGHALHLEQPEALAALLLG